MAKESDAKGVAAAQVEIEHELKFEVPPGWVMPSLGGVGPVKSAGHPRRMTQNATYFDTPDLDLLRARCTLRRRTGGTDSGWHLKTPGQEDGRVEHRLPLGRSAVGIPAELRLQVADLVGSKPLIPVALLRTERTRRELKSADGVVLALVEDDVVEATTYRDGERTQRWREVEVELVDGDAPDLRAVSEALIEAGLTASNNPAKLGRALAEQLAAANAEVADPSAGDVVLRYLGAQVGLLQAAEQGLRDEAPDMVHRARVATRRLRSALRSYRALFDREVTDSIRSEVAWLTGVLGGPRDAEVMRERLVDLVASLEPELVVGPVRTRVHETLAAEHHAAHAAMVQALDSPRYERLLGDLTHLLVKPPLLPTAAEPAESVLPELVTAAATQVFAQAEKARATNAQGYDEALHGVRKRAKAARYAAEAAGDAMGGARPLAEAWAQLQEALGAHQDSVVSRGVLMRLAEEARQAGEDTFTYGVLVEREYALARNVEAGYLPLLESASKATAKLDD